MARSGDRIHNPASRETMIFRRTAVDTRGQSLEIDLIVGVDGAVGVEHVHPQQSERFVVQRGEMTLRIAGRERILGAGDEAVVPAGTAHEWFNSGEEELHAVLEFTPAGRFEGFITTYFGLVKAGQVNERGRPGLLQTAVTLHAYRDTIVLTETPRVVRRFLMPVLSVFGRMLGLQPDYPYPMHAARGDRPSAAASLEIGSEPARMAS